MYCILLADVIYVFVREDRLSFPLCRKKMMPLMRDVFTFSAPRLTRPHYFPFFSRPFVELSFKSSEKFYKFFFTFYSNVGQFFATLPRPLFAICFELRQVWPNFKIDVVEFWKYKRIYSTNKLPVNFVAMLIACAPRPPTTTA